MCACILGEWGGEFKAQSATSEPKCLKTHTVLQRDYIALHASFTI